MPILSAILGQILGKLHNKTADLHDLISLAYKFNRIIKLIILVDGIISEMFVYLSKKISVPNGVPLSTLCWNQIDDFIGIGLC